MLRPQGAGQAARITDYLREVAFTPAGLRNRVQTDLLTGRHQEHLPLLLYRTRELDPLNLLIRWFVVGELVPQHTAKQLIAPDILQLLCDCGLLAVNDENFASPIMFAPFEQYWIATDTYTKLARGSGADDVLMVNSTTLFLLNVAIRTPCRTLLDLGTGCGVVAVVAAADFAGQVIATDLTTRAGIFARFNAWLNQSKNVEVATGDLFQPVAGRRFDRILSNPPFYVTPSSRRVFAENPMDLDGFCRNLVKQAPAHLEEGGFLQMLCEWPEIEGQPWEERLAEWFEGTGCDAIVWAGGGHDPVRYAQVRLPVVTAPAGKEIDYGRFEEWVEYYKAKKVKAIHVGFLSMRKRSGQNWVHFERVPSEPRMPSGEAILRSFAFRDHPRSDEQLLKAKFQVAPGTQLRKVVEFRDQEWISSGKVPMTQTSGFQRVRDLTPDVADFLIQMDGSVSLAERVDSLAREADVAPEQVRSECLLLVRTLLEQDFLRELP